MAGMRIALTTSAVALSLVASAGTPVAGDVAEAGAKLVIGCDGCWPAAFDFTPSGKQIFYLERYSGEIHRYTLKGGADVVWGSVGPINADGERGALGIAVDPRWDKGTQKQRKRNRWIYVFYTHQSPLENRIVRLRRSLKGGDGLKREHLLTIEINTATNHNAGPMRFGPDRKLYVVTGDQAEPARSQDLADPAGKVLRMTRTGGRPSDNPIAGSLAFSYGHRNSFGLTFDPSSGGLWQTENGPTCDDEVNLILPGANYGWGSGSTCPNTSTQGPTPRTPEHEWSPPIVPTGTAFCSGCGLGDAFEGDLLVGTYGGGSLIRSLSLDAERDDVTGETTAYDHPSGILAMARRPNGQVFFSDSDGIYLLTA